MVLEVVAGQGGREESQRWPLGELTVTVNYRGTRHILLVIISLRYYDTIIHVLVLVQVQKFILMYMSHTRTKKRNII